MNRKDKGNRNERRSKSLLESWGYEVYKSGGSLGAFDLIAIGSENIMLVQVKTNRRPNDTELIAMMDFKAPKGVVLKRVHIWVDRIGTPLIWNEEQIKDVLCGKPLEDYSIRQFRSSRKRKNDSKAKDRTKQRTSKRTTVKARAADTRTPRKRAARVAIRGKRENARVT